MFPSNRSCTKADTINPRILKAVTHEGNFDTVVEAAIRDPTSSRTMSTLQQMSQTQGASQTQRVCSNKTGLLPVYRAFVAREMLALVTTFQHGKSTEKAKEIQPKKVTTEFRTLCQMTHKKDPNPVYDSWIRDPRTVDLLDKAQRFCDAVVATTRDGDIRSSKAFTNNKSESAAAKSMALTATEAPTSKEDLNSLGPKGDAHEGKVSHPKALTVPAKEDSKAPELVVNEPPRKVAGSPKLQTTEETKSEEEDQSSQVSAKGIGLTDVDLTDVELTDVEHTESAASSVTLKDTGEHHELGSSTFIGEVESASPAACPTTMHNEEDCPNTMMLEASEVSQAGGDAKVDEDRVDEDKVDEDKDDDEDGEWAIISKHDYSKDFLTDAKGLP